MSEEQTAPEIQVVPQVEPQPEAAAAAEAAAPAAPAAPAGEAKPPRQERQRQDRPKQERPQQERNAGRSNDRPKGNDRGNNQDRRQGQGGQGGGPRHGGRPEGRPGSGRPDMFAEIDLDKLLTDSLYLDNQAHAVVSRMRDVDSGTRSQLRRLYGAVRRATRAPEESRQHEFVMLRARLAYTIARHGLRSLDQLERLLLAVTRRNEARGYERFRDLFEAIVAYNE